MEISYAHQVGWERGMSGGTTSSWRLSSIDFWAFSENWWLVAWCYFFKRTSVIAPSCNSSVTKLFKSGKGQMQCNDGRNATMVTMQLKDQGPVRKPVSEFVGICYTKKKHWSNQTSQLRGWIALSMNWSNRFLFAFAIILPEILVNSEPSRLHTVPDKRFWSLAGKKKKNRPGMALRYIFL